MREIYAARAIMSELAQIPGMQNMPNHSNLDVPEIAIGSVNNGNASYHASPPALLEGMYDNYVVVPSYASNEYIKLSPREEFEDYGSELTMFMSPATHSSQFSVASSHYGSDANYFRFEPEAIAKFNNSFKLDIPATTCTHDGYFSYEESDCCSSPDAPSATDPWVSCFKFNETDDQCTPLPKFSTFNCRPQHTPLKYDEDIIDSFDTTYLDLNVACHSDASQISIDAAIENVCKNNTVHEISNCINESSVKLTELHCLWEGCETRFLSQKTLVSHIVKHHVEGKKGEEFTCLWKNCVRQQKPFNARYKLLIHMRVHSGEKPNQCPVS